MSKIQHEKILIANDLLSGDVVFMGATGWVENHAASRIATNADEAAELQAIATAELAANHVVDAYLVDVIRDADGIPQPIHYREQMRTKGPSNRLDLGKQAIQGRAA